VGQGWLAAAGIPPSLGCRLDAVLVGIREFQAGVAKVIRVTLLPKR
jgi:hypothetical protein